MRLKLLKFAPQAIKLSRTVQGIARLRELKDRRVHNRWERAHTDVTYYELLAVLEEVRVKVIVKQDAGGK